MCFSYKWRWDPLLDFYKPPKVNISTSEFPPKWVLVIIFVLSICALGCFWIGVAGYVADTLNHPGLWIATGVLCFLISIGFYQKDHSYLVIDRTNRNLLLATETFSYLLYKMDILTPIANIEEFSKVVTHTENPRFNYIGNKVGTDTKSHFSIYISWKNDAPIKWEIYHARSHRDFAKAQAKIEEIKAWWKAYYLNDAVISKLVDAEQSIDAPLPNPNAEVINLQIENGHNKIGKIGNENVSEDIAITGNNHNEEKTDDQIDHPHDKIGNKTASDDTALTDNRIEEKINHQIGHPHDKVGNAELQLNITQEFKRLLLRLKLKSAEKGKLLDMAYELDKNTMIEEYKMIKTVTDNETEMIKLLVDKADTILRIKGLILKENRDSIVVDSNKEDANRNVPNYQGPTAYI